MNYPLVNFSDSHPELDDFQNEIINSLTSDPKYLSPKYLYDRKGSEIFEEICKQPEYYPTRTEIEILQRYGSELAKLVGPDKVLLELGSGASHKVRLLLDWLRPHMYVGVDISREFLLHSTQRLAMDYPWIHVRAICTDFSKPFALDAISPGQTLAFYPGSSIGNFEPEHAESFLKNLREVIGLDGQLLIGVDLKKDKILLDAAYNDAAGVTAAFNLNLLKRLRREIGADFRTDNFQHIAFYNETEGRVEMHLESLKSHVVRIGDLQFPFKKGERLNTEYSYKYSIPEFHSLARRAGFVPVKEWTDDQSLFCVYFLVAT